MSIVYQLMPRPDWAATTTIATRDQAGIGPSEWAEAIFDAQSLPLWGKALFVVREAVVRVLRIPPGDPAMLRVDRVVGDEAVIDTDDRHLRFVASVRPDDREHLLHVLTAVTFKGWRGRLYFVPVRFLHDPVTRAMMVGAARHLPARRAEVRSSQV